MLEEWRDMTGYERYYLISDQGRVKSKNRTTITSHGVSRRVVGRLLQGSKDADGRVRISLISENGRTYKLLSREVLRTFKGKPPEGKPYSLHGNGDPSDNRLENLRWGSPQENADDKARHGTHHNTAKTHCKRGHKFPVKEGSGGGNRRVCQACEYERKTIPLDPGAKQHGTSSGYVRHNCRCEKCRRWRSDEWYRRKALEIARSTRLEV